MVDDYGIQELMQREVYIGEKLVGTVVGERFHPRDELVQSMRIEVSPEVAQQYMRKPADLAPSELKSNFMLQMNYLIGLF